MLTHERIQALIHFLESSVFSRIMKVMLVVLCLLGLIIIYDLLGYKNFKSEEAMDAAQVARNLATGHGYTTLFIRPFSVFLMQRGAAARDGAAAATAASARVENNHPDLANPPVYPAFLAGLMKTGAFRWDIVTNKSYWSTRGYFLRYQPEFLIAVANQVLLIGAAFLTFFIARKMFDPAAAWLSALLVLGSNLLWQFSVSGLSTILLMDIFLGLMLTLLAFETSVSQAEPSHRKQMGLAIGLGLLLALGMLTRYSFGWLLVPLVAYLALFGGPARVIYIFTMGCAFALPVLPWIFRNWHVSHTLFGVAGYAAVEGSVYFQGDNLEKDLHPYLNAMFRLLPYLTKLKVNLHRILDGEITTFTASWSLMLFFAGLLLGFRSQAAKRLRYFVMGCLVTFVVVQALGRTHLSDDVPVFNSENLLVVLAPMTFVYGVVFFLILLDQMKLPLPQLRYVVMGGLVLLCSVSFIAQVWSPGTNPVAFPQYHPFDLQKVGKSIPQSDLIMSDTPWGIAWYGNHQCISMPQSPKDDFFAINDYIKPVHALFFTQKSAKLDLIELMNLPDAENWDQFVASACVKNQVPHNFPLENVVTYSSGLLLSDRSL